MTYEEAAEKIKEKICCEKPVQHFCTDDCRAGEEYCEFAMAIAAIDKQIPKPPKETNLRTLPNGTKIRSNRIRPKCQNCTQTDVWLFPMQKYCHECGQKIHWSV